jgi:hypothetical protein
MRDNMNWYNAHNEALNNTGSRQYENAMREIEYRENKRRIDSWSDYENYGIDVIEEDEESS